MRETWRVIPQYEHRYEASSEGRIRRALSAPPYRSTYAGRILSLHFAQHPKNKRPTYLRVGLRTSQENHLCYVHHLVAAAFLGIRPTGMVVNHRDGNRANNRPGNLEYVTPAENYADQKRRGTSRGERNPRAILNPELVRRIRAERLRGRTVPDICNELGVTVDAVYPMLHGRTWTHVV